MRESCSPDFLHIICTICFSVDPCTCQSLAYLHEWIPLLYICTYMWLILDLFLWRILINTVLFWNNISVNEIISPWKVWKNLIVQRSCLRIQYFIIIHLIILLWNCCSYHIMNKLILLILTTSYLYFIFSFYLSVVSISVHTQLWFGGSMFN